MLYAKRRLDGSMRPVAKVAGLRVQVEVGVVETQALVPGLAMGGRIIFRPLVRCILCMENH